jgi:DoxX-like family
MLVAGASVSCLVALAPIVSGRGKLVKDPAQMKTMTRVGFPADKLWLLAAAEIAGAFGIVQRRMVRSRNGQMLCPCQWSSQLTYRTRSCGWYRMMLATSRALPCQSTQGS